MNHDIQRHDDHEGRMAKSDLKRLAEYSAKLFAMIDENEELDGWVQEKISIAADYIGSVYHYLDYEKTAAEAINQGPREFEESIHESVRRDLAEKWSQKYKNSINCDSPKGFSQRAHCAGRKK